MIGAILAGGRATRLGPLAAQLNKSLVTVANKPMLVRQVQQLRAVGCELIYVVVSPGAREQVDAAITRAGLRNVVTLEQVLPMGPGDAIDTAKIEAKRQGTGGGLYVLMSDTLISGSLPDSTNFVVVADAPATRSWCHYDARAGVWRDGVAAAETEVAVGAFHFSDLDALGCALSHAELRGGELGMAPVLNHYQHFLGGSVLRWPTTDWQDVGDVGALARANSNGFISREFHHVESRVPGTITKHGDVSSQWTHMMSAPHGAKQLYPAIYDIDRDFYTMEHVALPSLAELWLYWPSRPEMWTHIAEQLTGQLRELHWPGSPRKQAVQPTSLELEERAHSMYVNKLLARYVDPPIRAWQPNAPLVVNGREVRAGRELVDDMTQWFKTNVMPTVNDHRAWVHGDPNFTNVLWSLETGSFKLIDPRGRWGGAGSWGDSRYDLAKIAYSPIFASITHRLFDLQRDDEAWRLRFWTERDDEIRALYDPIKWTDGDEFLRFVVHMLLAGAPLHPEPEASALYLAACVLAEDWL